MSDKKICRDCAHQKQWIEGVYCRAPDNPATYSEPDIVHGYSFPTYKWPRNCRDLRENEEACGLGAKWFKERKPEIEAPPRAKPWWRFWE